MRGRLGEISKERLGERVWVRQIMRKKWGREIERKRVRNWKSVRDSEIEKKRKRDWREILEEIKELGNGD